MLSIDTDIVKMLKLNLMKKPALFLVILLVVVGIGFLVFQRTSLSGPVEVILMGLSDSGVSGTANLQTVESQTSVTINLSGSTSGLATIYQGNCESTQLALHTLSPVVEGNSSTLLDIELPSLLRQKPLAFVVVKSEFDPLERIVCGEIQ